MAEKAVWTGTISVGMVTLPVKLWRAARPQDIAFNLLHRTCGARIQHKRWCSLENMEVAWEDVTRGFEFAKDEYVMLSDADFEQLPLPSKRLVEVSAFVETGDIDPIFFERSFYVVPDEGGERPYALLLKTLAEKNVMAVGSVAIRNKEQICTIRPHDGHLLLETLYYPDEIEAVPPVALGGVRLREEEREMARTLVELMRRPFQPAAYEDRYRAALVSLIEAKARGASPEFASAEADAPNLADALARSVEDAMRKESKEAQEKSDDDSVRRAS